MKTYWGWGIAPRILDLSPRLIHATTAFTPKERAPDTRWIGGWVGARASLDAVVKRKIPSPRQE